MNKSACIIVTIIDGGKAMIEVCLLGTGGMMPLQNRWLTSLLVRCNGKMILIDCGEGTQIPIKMAGWGFKSIDVVLFTHFHADHIAGLPGFLLTLGNSGRVEPLTIIGPKGLGRVVEGLCVIAPELPYEIKLIELDENKDTEIIFDDIYVKSIFVDHKLTCFSYSVELKRQGKFDVNKANELSIPLKYWKVLQKGESIVLSDRIITPEMVLGTPRKGIKICYCTDTRPMAALVDFISEADLFICEGMYGDVNDLVKAMDKKHMTFSEAGLLAKQGEVKELWLTHYSPALVNPEEFLSAAKDIFTNTYLGKDLLKKTIKWN